MPHFVLSVKRGNEDLRTQTGSGNTSQVKIETEGTVAEQEMAERVVEHEDGDTTKYDGAVDAVVETMTDVLGGALGLESKPFEQPGYGYEDDADYGDGMLDDDLYGETEPDAMTSTMGSRMESESAESYDDTDTNSGDDAGERTAPHDDDEKHEAESVEDQAKAEAYESGERPTSTNDDERAGGEYDDKTEDYKDTGDDYGDKAEDYDDAGEDYKDTGDNTSPDQPVVKEANYDPYADEVETIDPIETETNSYGYDDTDDYGNDGDTLDMADSQKADYKDAAEDYKDTSDSYKDTAENYNDTGDNYETQSVAEADYGGGNDLYKENESEDGGFGGGYDAHEEMPMATSASSTDAPAEAAMEEVALDDSSYEEPTYEEPEVNTASHEQPTYEEPTYEEPIDEMDDGMDEMMVDG